MPADDEPCHGGCHGAGDDPQDERPASQESAEGKQDKEPEAVFEAPSCEALEQAVHVVSLPERAGGLLQSATSASRPL